MSENCDNGVNKSVINWDIQIYGNTNSTAYEIRKFKINLITF